MQQFLKKFIQRDYRLYQKKKTYYIDLGKIRYYNFFVTTLVCGAIEYFTAYYLELTHNGQKWWDYTGYFLNLHGRICAEGLLIFGLGGLAIVYILAPLIDNYIKKIKPKVLVVSCAILVSLFTIDQIYSSKHPNEGKGITDYAVTMNIEK